jgi:hypothetical protein
MELFLGLLWIVIAICCFRQILKDKEDWFVKVGEILATLFIFLYGCILIYGGICTIIN